MHHNNIWDHILNYEDIKKYSVTHYMSTRWLVDRRGITAGHTQSTSRTILHGFFKRRAEFSKQKILLAVHYYIWFYLGISGREAKQRKWKNRTRNQGRKEEDMAINNGEQAVRQKQQQWMIKVQINRAPPWMCWKFLI